uniref:Uncharacterized protein n=1 Tax=Meloidogyne javanica TaxID=6303 RepID=A0A915LEE3_MELJA
KLKKSAVLREKFQNLQIICDLPDKELVKHTEIRWTSSYDMMDRWMQNEKAIKLLLASDATLPKFHDDDWNIISALKEILSPIYHATIALQNRHTTISTVIPLFRVIVHKLEKDQENYV